MSKYPPTISEETSKALSQALDDARDRMNEDRLWSDIRQAADTNPALKETLDRARILYELGK
jgi:hypothetical protein